MDVTRRQFLTVAGAASGLMLLSGCGFVPSASKPKPSAGTLSFTTWGTDAELNGFKRLISGFEKANSGAKVALNAVPYEQMFTNIDAQLQAGNPPDIWRAGYTNIGSYAAAGQLLDLGSALPSDFSDRFTPQAWAAVQNGGSPHGVPHHTDTSVIFYNKSALAAAGVTSVPTQIDDAWTWDEFLDLAAVLRGKLPAEKYPFGYNWQGNSVGRWLSLLYQADGRFLTEDLDKPAIDSDAGRAAVEFGRGLFPANLVPPNDTPKSTTYAADNFYNQTTAMVFSGAFAIPDAQAAFGDDWGATFHLRRDRQGGDFGGNPLVASKVAADKADLIAAFFDYVTQEEQMRDFCSGAFLLPTRRDLVDNGIEFTTRPDLSPVFLGQASVVQASDSSQVASPAMPKIITVLKDELETGFVGGRDAGATVTALASGIATAVSG